MNELLVKGAPELLLQRCRWLCTEDGSVVPLTEPMRQRCLAHLEQMSRRSLRCLALAGKTEEGPLRSYDGPHHPAHAMLADVDKYEAIEQDLCLFGIVGIKDPARIEVRDSIALCKKAGIRVFMITGDNKLTAESIARDVGILQLGEEAEASFEGSPFPRFLTSSA